MNAETNRRLENLIRLGTIDSVILSQIAHTVTVNLGDIVTAPLRLINLRAGKDKSHDLPSLGEECVVISPSGELALGLVICGLNNENFPTPSQDPAIKLRVFEDGAVICYDTNNHILEATLPKDGKAILTAPQGLTIYGNVSIHGNLNTTGDIETNADVKAGSISLKNHKHNAVKGGSDTSGGAI